MLKFEDFFTHASPLIHLQRFRPIKERVRSENFPYHITLKDIDGVSTCSKGFIHCFEVKKY